MLSGRRSRLALMLLLLLLAGAASSAAEGGGENDDDGGDDDDDDDDIGGEDEERPLCANREPHLGISVVPKYAQEKSLRNATRFQYYFEKEKAELQR